MLGSSHSSILIMWAVGLAGFMVLVGRKLVRSGERAQLVSMLIAVPGVYLILVAQLLHETWLWVPAVALVVGGNGIQLWAMRRARRLVKQGDRDAGSAGSSRPA